MTADLKICPYFRTGGNVHDRYGLYQTRSICLRVVVLNVMTFHVHFYYLRVCAVCLRVRGLFQS